MQALSNPNLTYYVATAVVLSNGERKTVLTVPATPESDAEGPEFTNVLMDSCVALTGLRHSASYGK